MVEVSTLENLEFIYLHIEKLGATSERKFRVNDTN